MYGSEPRAYGTKDALFRTLRSGRVRFAFCTCSSVPSRPLSAMADGPFAKIRFPLTRLLNEFQKCPPLFLTRDYVDGQPIWRSRKKIVARVFRERKSARGSCPTTPVHPIHPHPPRPLESADEPRNPPANQLLFSGDLAKKKDCALNGCDDDDEREHAESATKPCRKGTRPWTKP